MKKLWPHSVRILLVISLLLAALLLVAEIGFGEGSTTTVGFYALAGFVSCMVLIVIALLIGKIIKRKDSYYDD